MTDTRPITGWTIQATCPHCAGLLAHIADGRPDGHTSRAIARCTTCDRTYVVQLTIVDASPDFGKRSPHPAGCTCARCTNARATHCAHGHPLAGDNVYRSPRGTRECRTCRRDGAARRRAGQRRGTRQETAA